MEKAQEKLKEILILGSYKIPLHLAVPWMKDFPKLDGE
jgi:hypothetical protein